MRINHLWSEPMEIPACLWHPDQHFHNCSTECPASVLHYRLLYNHALLRVFPIPDMVSTQMIQLHMHNWQQPDNVHFRRSYHCCLFHMYIDWSPAMHQRSHRSDRLPNQALHLRVLWYRCISYTWYYLRSTDHIFLPD